MLGLKGFGVPGIVKFELKGTMGGKRSNGSAQHGRSSRLRDLASEFPRPSLCGLVCEWGDG